MSAKSGSLSVVCYKWDREKCPLYIHVVAGSQVFRGCLSIEVNGRTVGLSELSIILWVSVKRGSTVLQNH